MDLLQLLRLFLLNIQSHTLLYDIFTQLRAIKFDGQEENKILTMWAYCDGETNQDFERKFGVTCNLIKTKMSVLLRQSYVMEKHIIRLDFPKQIPEIGFWAYLRDESIFPNYVPSSIKFVDSLYFQEELSERENLRLQTVKALLGRVRPNLRAVHADIHELKKVVFFWFFFDSTVAVVDREMAEKVAEEAASGFGIGYNYNLEVDEVGYPVTLPSVGYAIFRKSETLCNNIDEDTTEEENAEETLWHALLTDELCRYKKKLGDFHFFLRNALRWLIKPNLRAIKFAVDPLKRKGYLWFYFDGRYSQDDLKLVSEIVSRTRESCFSVQEYIKNLPFPEKIPEIGQYVFLRDESYSYDSVKPLKVNDEIISEITKAFHKSMPYKKFLQEQQSTFALMKNLRTVEICVNEVDKILYLLFFFNEMLSHTQKTFLKEFAQKLKTKMPVDYSVEAYAARYDYPSKPPKIGEALYISPKETECQKEELIDVFLQAISQALIGKIRPNLRAVKADVNEFRRVFYFWFYFDEVMSKSDYTIAQEVIQEASFRQDFFIEQEVKQHDYPLKIPSRGCLVYSRFEP